MRVAVMLLAAAVAACGGSSGPKPGSAASPVRGSGFGTVPETVSVRDPELTREVARLRVLLLENSAQLAEMERRVEEATTEVVRAMARLRTLATRAEAASAIAEAEVTLEQLRRSAGAQAPPEAGQAESALRAAGAAFDAENFGGAVYLATQAKRAATAGRGRLADSDGAQPRAGERAFAVPVPLITTARANLRTAPSASADVVTTADAGTPLTGHAHELDWLRVTLLDGRTAWVHQSLVRNAVPESP